MRRLLPVLIVLSLFLLAGCKDGDSTAEVAVTLREWEVTSEPLEVRPGKVSFEVSNSGTKQHQFIVVKSDLPPGQLPTIDVQVDESKVNISGRVEAFAAGATATLELELFPGKYLLICNLVDQQASGVADPHYLNGMVQPFLILDE